MSSRNKDFVHLEQISLEDVTFFPDPNFPGAAWICSQILQENEVKVQNDSDLGLSPILLQLPYRYFLLYNIDMDDTMQ